ncbi:MAG: long-chain fatty acid--CoA ligase [Deltaproteobacteria bacterium]|nr:long-chain fatty acid--CoA ligase [Deltaproteobacteria bacterium]
MIYGDCIGRWGRAFAGSEALVDAITKRRYTYGALLQESSRMAHFLRGELGIAKGDRVACLSFNRTEYITLFLALSRLGAVLVPLNFRLARGEFIYFLEDSTPKAIFFDRQHQEVVAALKADISVPHYVCLDPDRTIGVSLPEIWDSLPTGPLREVEIQADDPQLIIYTSGTTGLPKGVLLTHGMLTWNAFNTIAGWGLRPGDKTILHAAMFYTAGWNVFTLPIFLSRGVNILIQSFDADLILDLIQNEGVTVFFGVPTMFQMLMDSSKFADTDFSKVRFMVSGGAPLGETIFNAFKAQKSVHIREGYGLTEVGPNCFLANGKLGTIGHPMPYLDVKLVGPDGGEVLQGEEGEILLKGPNVCAGYLNKPGTTEKAIIDGWFHTGDLGKIDSDGHMAIVGRLKDMIISGGANIYPAEIERAIETHPAVIGSAVIGVPDPKWGEVGKAIVELKPGKTLTLSDLLDHLEDRLGKFKRPKYLVVVDALPRTPASGKVQKFILKEEYGKILND